MKGRKLALCKRKGEGVYALVDAQTGEIIDGVQGITLKTFWDDGIPIQEITVKFTGFGLAKTKADIGG